MEKNILKQGNILIDIIIALIVLVLVGAGLYYYLSKQAPVVSEIDEQQNGEEEEDNFLSPESGIVDFESCISAGNQPLDSEVWGGSTGLTSIMPRKCVTPGGKVFVERIVSEDLHELISKRFCEKYIYVPKLLTADYDILEIDLNDDEIDEIIAGSEYCYSEEREYYVGGNRAKPFIILQKIKNEWSVIGSFNTYKYFIENTGTTGYRDITIRYYTSPETVEEKIYYWNGSEYMTNQGKLPLLDEAVLEGIKELDYFSDIESHDYDYRIIELDDNTDIEVLIYLHSINDTVVVANSGNGEMLLFEEIEEGWRMLGEMNADIYFGLDIENEKTDGYYNISVTLDNGGMNYTTIFYEYNETDRFYSKVSSEQWEAGAGP